MSIPHLTVSEVRARAVVLPLARPIRTAISTIPSAPLVLIDVTTREGIVGSAYIFTYTPAALSALCRLVVDIGAELIGQPVAPRTLRRSDCRFRLLGWHGTVGMAAGARHGALGCTGARRRKPVAQILGGALRPLEAYDSFGVIDLKSDAEVLAASVASGFKAIKIKIGDGDLARDVAAVRSCANRRVRCPAHGRLQSVTRCAGGRASNTAAVRFRFALGRGAGQG